MLRNVRKSQENVNENNNEEKKVETKFQKRKELGFRWK